MGQYYEVYMEQDGKVDILDRSVDGEYTPAKLMEHSWAGNFFVDTVCSMIYKSPAIIAWVGDYANETMEEKRVYEKVWKEGIESHGVTANKLSMEGRYLVNHTKKQYIDFDKYAEKSTHIDEWTHFPEKTKWTVHPLPLLTALGNGRGGGDYYGVNADKVGSWAMDSISVEDDVPDGYQMLNIYFTE